MGISIPTTAAVSAPAVPAAVESTMVAGAVMMVVAVISVVVMGSRVMRSADVTAPSGMATIGG